MSKKRRIQIRKRNISSKKSKMSLITTFVQMRLPRIKNTKRRRKMEEKGVKAIMWAQGQNCYEVMWYAHVSDLYIKSFPPFFRAVIHALQSFPHSHTVLFIPGCIHPCAVRFDLPPQTQSFEDVLLPFMYQVSTLLAGLLRYYVCIKTNIFRGPILNRAPRWGETSRWA